MFDLDIPIYCRYSLDTNFKPAVCAYFTVVYNILLYTPVIFNSRQIHSRLGFIRIGVRVKAYVAYARANKSHPAATSPILIPNLSLSPRAASKMLLNAINASSKDASTCRWRKKTRTFKDLCLQSTRKRWKGEEENYFNMLCRLFIKIMIKI